MMVRVLVLKLSLLRVGIKRFAIWETASKPDHAPKLPEGAIWIMSPEGFPVFLWKGEWEEFKPFM